jgi:hypothetical protein
MGELRRIAAAKAITLVSGGPLSLALSALVNPDALTAIATIKLDSPTCARIKKPGLNVHERRACGT